jgi:hypothetical protein
LYTSPRSLHKLNNNTSTAALHIQVLIPAHRLAA